ncbi:MAG TPA: type II toxin-antitoxin system RelE/ParE family toxin [Magnetospirillaceae bacterium]|jgi:proteic killer suppression protein
MIKSIRHRGLRRLYEADDRRGVAAEHVEKLAAILAQLDRAAMPDDMALPGLKLHPLKGDMAGFWSVTVRANWRIVFRFEERDVADVDLIDYH